MWSGPRNLSTALMRAWGSRADTAVVDEPLYAAYLAATGLDHPARAAVLQSQPTDWQAVAEALLGPVPGGRPIFYQKHMAHHLLPGVGRAWLGGLRHAFLIREPAGMLASLARVTPDVTAADTGLPQQVALFEQTAERLGEAPPVIDAADVLADPPGVLAAALRRPRRGLRPGDARVGARPAPRGRRLGAALVRGRLRLDRLRRPEREHRRAGRARRAPRRPRHVPPALRPP